MTAHTPILASAHHGMARPEAVRVDALTARIAKWRGMGMAPERVAAPEIARQRAAAADRVLAANLRALAWECTRAAVAAERGDYHESAHERAVLNAAYDVTECDALYDRINEIAPMQEVL